MMDFSIHLFASGFPYLWEKKLQVYVDHNVEFREKVCAGK